MRLGNMRGGTDGIMSHAWFSDIKFQNILNKTVVAPWIPAIKSDTDRSLFDEVDEEEPDKGVVDPAWTWDDDF